jgi:hypothetical protein
MQQVMQRQQEERDRMELRARLVEIPRAPLLLEPPELQVAPVAPAVLPLQED